MSNLPSFEVFSDSISDNIRFEHGIHRGIDIKSVFTEFMSFVQRDGVGVRKWDLCSGGSIDDYYGATFRIPLTSDASTIQDSIATIDKDGNSLIKEKINKCSPCYYISITYNNVNKDTYKNFINSRYMTLAEVSNSYKFTEGGYNSNAIGTGEAISIIPHILYDTNLYACEQGMSPCKEITDLTTKTFHDITHNVDNVTVEPNLLNYSVQYTTYGASDVGCYTTPIPGTGCPFFVFGDRDKLVFDVVEFYFIKTDTNATVALCFSSSSDDSVKSVWQTVSFGLLDVDDTSYKWPLFIAGGSTALKPSSYKYIRSWASNVLYTTIYGNVYDFNMHSITNNNTNLLYPTRLVSTGISNFLILSPSGKWVYTYNYVQNTRDNLYYDEYRTVQTEVIPASLDDCQGSNSYVYGSNYCNHDDLIYDSSNAIVHDIYITSDNDYSGFYGRVHDIYYSDMYNDNTLFVYNNNDKYIKIPNGWYGRIPYYICQESESDINNDYFRYIKDNSYSNCMLVKVGVKS